MKTKKTILNVLKDIKLDYVKYGVTSRNFFLAPALAFHNPGMIFSILYRVERYFLYQSNVVLRIFGIFFYPFYFFITYYLLSYHIEPSANIEGGLMLHNREIVISDFVTIGKNVSIMGGVTIGTDFNTYNTNIHIGNNVKIGVGAKVIAKGKLSIAEGVTIGANAVVVKSILEKKSVYGGVPAKKIR